MAPGGKKTPKKGKTPPKTKPQQKRVDKSENDPENDPENEPGFGLFDNPNFVITGVGPTPQNATENDYVERDERGEDSEEEDEEKDDSEGDNEIDGSSNDESESDDDMLQLIMELLKKKKKKKSATQKKKPRDRTSLPDLSMPPPKLKRPKPPVQTFDHVGLKFYMGAKDEEGTNPVALMIDREVTARQAIHNSEPESKAQDYKYALGGYDHLEPIRTYCILTGPREFDTWKDQWKDHVSKVARGVHPSLIKEKCLMAMKESLSTTTSQWIENRHTLDGRRDDPDAILKALQDHAQENANVPSMLLKQTQMRSSANSNHVETNRTIASVVHYFEKACKGNLVDGIHKWLLLIAYGDIEKLRNKLMEKWERVDRDEFFRIIENYFMTNKKSSGLFANGEAYNVNASTNWTGQSRGSQDQNQKNTQPQKPQQSAQQQWQPKPQQQQQSHQSQVFKSRSNGNGKCGYCGGARHSGNLTQRRAQCPAANEICGTCNRSGHISSVCRSSNPTANNLESNHNQTQPKPSTQPQTNNVELGRRFQGRPGGIINIFGLDLDVNHVEIVSRERDGTPKPVKPAGHKSCKKRLRPASNEQSKQQNQVDNPRGERHTEPEMSVRDKNKHSEDFAVLGPPAELNLEPDTPAAPPNGRRWTWTRRKPDRGGD